MSTPKNGIVTLKHYVIRDEFKVHLLNEEGVRKTVELAEAFSKFLNAIEVACGTEGREVALVRTHLQLASFYAKRAMATRAENQITEL